MGPRVLVEAPGLPADWLNAWLAAIGIASLLDEVKLSWSDEVVPHAIFTTATSIEDFTRKIAERLPKARDLESTAIARHHKDTSNDFERTVLVDTFRERAKIERKDRGYLLAASVSDMSMRRDPDEIDHGPFDPPAPRGETLFSRAIKCAQLLGGDLKDLEDAVGQTLRGTFARIKANGLGFDCRRLSTGVQTSGRGSEVHVNLVIELLALAALRHFPCRGDGYVVRQRGWNASASRRGAFVWYTWQPPLDIWAIDALLDLPERLTTHAWQSVPYRPSSSSDTTRAYFSKQTK